MGIAIITFITVSTLATTGVYKYKDLVIRSEYIKNVESHIEKAQFTRYEFAYATTKERALFYGKLLRIRKVADSELHHYLGYGWAIPKEIYTLKLENEF